MAARDSYKTLDDIASELDIPLAKLRTLVARLDIQPRRFPDDLRKLYYSPEDVKQMRSALGK